MMTRCDAQIRKIAALATSSASIRLPKHHEVPPGGRGCPPAFERHFCGPTGFRNYGRYGCDVFIAFRLLKVALKLGLLLALAFVALVAWGNFWPAPSHAPRISCPPHLSDPCRVVSGRVLYHTAFGINHRAHVVLMSRSSVTLPGITSIELPRLRNEPPGVGFGDWITVFGKEARGSHGERDFHAHGFATAEVAMRCGSPDVRFPCKRVALHDPNAQAG
jgi:hypothetical protein